MEQSDILDQLNMLVRLDIDATRAYGQAISEIDIALIRESLDQFRSDHEHHIRNLSAIIRQFGGKPPKMSLDLNDFLITGFTDIRSAVGTMEALNAMATNEKLTNRTYSAAVGKSFPPKIESQIMAHYGDERRHLGYIQQHLKILKENPHYYEKIRPESETGPHRI